MDAESPPEEGDHDSGFPSVDSLPSSLTDEWRSKGQDGGHLHVSVDLSKDGEGDVGLDLYGTKAVYAALIVGVAIGILFAIGIVKLF